MNTTTQTMRSTETVNAGELAKDGVEVLLEWTADMVKFPEDSGCDPVEAAATAEELRVILALLEKVNVVALLGNVRDGMDVAADSMQEPKSLGELRLREASKHLTAAVKALTGRGVSK